MTQEELNKILEKHELWLKHQPEGERADLAGANLEKISLPGVNLECANLEGVKLAGANLAGAKLSWANLQRAELKGADLAGARLKGANLAKVNFAGANLAGVDFNYADITRTNLAYAKGLLSAVDYMNSNFEKTKEGYIVYKTFWAAYKPSENWIIEPGSIISENVNYLRTDDFGCGINVGTLDYIKSHNSENVDIYKLLIKFEWAAGIVVPYSTEGNIRCERALILEKLEVLK